ncbi:glucosamine-6-phosphate deaminase [Allorhodopirellula solitaria]|uniref:Glucosamine-6-phosphate deaminase 1 n=1 Tax=Allorhodopirellula solitaria TaxID=2527987 RepID=A0A5C5XSN0_9BACT|nr:glucosamine-6-phosphate deaminase [Allorhodopirellula solitaria]TWT64702.1 Glucosamine-6-phosphate deaminase 1 [Allorhodopirellula solitaria]
MRVQVCSSPVTLGQNAAEEGATKIRNAIRDRGQATILVATGASQFETLAALVQASDIDWSRVTGFHLDEYIGLPSSHGASFRNYLKERFVDRVPIGAFHYVNGDHDATAECKRLGELIHDHEIDVAFIGIGENAHLAFNDPPADLDTQQSYLIVDLDEACRQQQLGEGWFDTLDDVPRQAISMSVSQILKSKHIVCSVPDERKAVAVRDSLTGPVSSATPASVLQSHPSATLYLDPPAASLIDPSQFAPADAEV